jgi:Protein of unknown function (DUF664)
MVSAELLVDTFSRIREVVHRVVDGLTPEQLAFRVNPEANSIAWLVWHLTRIQDDHLADAAGADQVWTSQGWVERFGLVWVAVRPRGHRRRALSRRRGRRAGGLRGAPRGLLRRHPPADDPVCGAARRRRPGPHRGPVRRLGWRGAPSRGQRSTAIAKASCAEDLLEGRYQYRSAGRTSIAPPRRAAGIREASSIAASRSSASKT